MKDVLVVGSAVLDFVYRMEDLPTRAEKYRADHMELVGGGCAANAAVAIARLGGRPSLIARFGDDEVRGLVCDDLAREGVDLSRLSVAPQGRSAVSSVYVDHAGERQIMAFRGEGLSEGPSPIAPNDSVVLADTRWPAAARVAFAATSGPRILDGEAPVPQDLAAAATHVVFSEQGAQDFTQNTDTHAALVAAAQMLPGFVAITCGANGVIWWEDGPQHMPGFHVDVLDTLGAGDVWHGAFALAIAEGETLRDAMYFASAAAAIKCQGTGGRRSAPDRAQLEAFLKERT